MINSALARDLKEIINASHAKTWEIFDIVRRGAAVYGPKSARNWRTPGEPAFVSTLLEKAINSERLRASLRGTLEPLGLCDTEPLVSGIFIHQKPKILFKGSQEQIELGDLLLVRHHFKIGGYLPEGRAVLLQAKSGKRPVSGPLRNKEESQFKLYSDWSTQFTFPHHELGPPPDGSAFWDFTKGPGNYAASGEYGLVSNGRFGFNAFPDETAWAVGPAVRMDDEKPSNVTATTSLAAAFEDFMFGRWGRSWDTECGPEDHWSNFIGECLEAAVDWRDYPVQRLGARYPRIRDLTELCFKMAEAGARFAVDWESATVMPRWAREMRLDNCGREEDRAREYRYRVNNLLRGAGGYYQRQHPGIGRDYETQPPRGISVLYVATCGPTSLQESALRPQA